MTRYYEYADEAPETGEIGLIGELIGQTVREAEGKINGLGGTSWQNPEQRAALRQGIVAQARSFLRGSRLDGWCLACGADPAVIRRALERAYPWMREGRG